MNGLLNKICRILLVLVAMNTCNNQRRCRISAALADDTLDPCPGLSKYLQVAFKCKPDGFKTRITCEGKDMHLVCKKSHRIAFYSALYGASKSGTPECRSNNTVTEACSSRCALDEVMTRCQGKRKCHIPVTEQTFGNPCPPNTHKYLEIKYSCVPKHILRLIRRDEEFPRYFCGDEGTEGLNNITVLPALPVQPSTVILPTTTVSSQDPAKHLCNTSAPGSSNVTCILPGDHPEIIALEDRYIGFLANWFQMWQHVKANKEKFILYAVVGLLSGIVLLLLVIICKIKHNQRHRKHSETVTSPPAVQPATGPRAEIPLLHHPPESYEPVELISYQNQSTFNHSSGPESRTASRLADSRASDSHRNNTLQRRQNDSLPRGSSGMPRASPHGTLPRVSQHDPVLYLSQQETLPRRGPTSMSSSPGPMSTSTPVTRPTTTTPRRVSSSSSSHPPQSATTPTTTQHQPATTAISSATTPTTASSPTVYIPPSLDSHYPPPSASSPLHSPHQLTSMPSTSSQQTPTSSTFAPYIDDLNFPALGQHYFGTNNYNTATMGSRSFDNYYR